MQNAVWLIVFIKFIHPQFHCMLNCSGSLYKQFKPLSRAYLQCAALLSSLLASHCAAVNRVHPMNRELHQSLTHPAQNRHSGKLSGAWELHSPCCTSLPSITQGSLLPDLS